MATKVQKAKVGVFLLIGFSAIAAIMVYILGFRTGHEQRFVIVFERSVLGLNKGGLVQYLGVPVGKVDDIFVTDDGKARVEVLIDPKKVQLHNKVDATLEFFSFATGTMCVALSNNNPTDGLLPEGAAIPATQSLVENFSSQSADMITAMRETIEKFNTALDGLGSGELTDTVRQVKSFISETEGFVEDARETLTVLTDDVHGSVDDVKGTITKFNELAESTKGLVDTANAALADVHEKIKPIDFAKTEQTVREEFVALSKRLQSTSEQFEKTAASLSFDSGNVQHTLLDTMRTLNETLEALRDVAVHLQDDPSALVWGKGNANKRNPK